MNERRPGIITAVGIMSVTIACISGLFSLGSLFSTIGMFAMSKVRLPPPPTMVAPLPAPSATVTIGGIPANIDSSDDAMAEPQRRIVIDTLSRMSDMDEQRQKHLDVLLSVSGQKVFPFGDRVTPRLIQSNVNERGTIPSTTGGAGANLFVIGTGTLEIYDDHAVFRPDGSSEVVNAAANPDSTAAGDPSANTTGTPPPNYSAPPAVNSRTGRPRTATTRAFLFKLSPQVAMASGALAVLHGLLAIYLLICGTMVLRDSQSAPKLHWIYVAIKIPLVIAAAWVGWYFWRNFGNQFFGATAPTGRPPPPAFMGTFMAMGTLFSSMLALAYPVALVFVLRSRTARSYYGAVRGVSPARF